jgi:translation initiation factor 1 (eIF-1/SUI1)
MKGFNVKIKIWLKNERRRRTNTWIEGYEERVIRIITVASHFISIRTFQSEASFDLIFI